MYAGVMAFVLALQILSLFSVEKYNSLAKEEDFCGCVTEEMEHIYMVGKVTYLTIYSIDAGAVLVSAIMLDRLIRNKNRDVHRKHQWQIIKYTLVLLISIGFKIALVP